jgi:cysteine desulfuration protein SufE
MPATEIMTFDELLDEFEQLPDWEDRCDLLIDLGMELPKLPEEERVESNKVRGCQSNVWLVATLDQSQSPPVLDLRAESDSMFVSGLIAVLLAVYNGKTPEEILAINAEDVFRKLDLQRHLSSQRRNGLAGMVQRVRALAVESLHLKA